ncbi:MAG TPA: ribonuclease III [Bryobacteraceae bacterium]|jgi:ribonuclease-3|nr:ribonuclease III [Bryobacteraceae bacterium]
MAADLQVLETRIGHSFRDKNLLVRALTHKSVCTDRKPDNIALFDNEQFEFLGDAILGFLVSEALVQIHPLYPEGKLSKLKAHLVSAAHLFRIAKGLNLGDYLHLGRGEEMSGGRQKKALLADALEALIAAMYLDGGIETARVFVMREVIDDWRNDNNGDPHIADYKTALQEKAQVLGLPQPRYVIIRESGPEHAKTFMIEVRLGPHLTSSGEGTSKKAAGQNAARVMIDHLEGRSSNLDDSVQRQ